MLRVLGVDQSLTSSGLSLFEPDNGTVQLHRITTGKMRGHARLAHIKGTIGAWATGCDLVVMEGLSFGARGSALLDLAGLSWLIRHELWALGIPYAIVDPATRAKYITGNGGAGKDECLIAVLKRFPGVSDGIDGNDHADALTLMQMGMDAYGLPLVKMPADRTALLRAVRTDKNRKGQPKIDWPEIKREAA
jgi:Holliday junction resolvasome RuvABC endonuclease subunit